MPQVLDDLITTATSDADENQAFRANYTRITSYNVCYTKLLRTGITAPQTIIGFIGITAAAAFACLFASKLGDMVLPRPKETRVADFLPFDRLLPDGMTIKCKDGSLCRRNNFV